MKDFHLQPNIPVMNCGVAEVCCLVAKKPVQSVRAGDRYFTLPVTVLFLLVYSQLTNSLNNHHTVTVCLVSPDVIQFQQLNTGYLSEAVRTFQSSTTVENAQQYWLHHGKFVLHVRTTLGCLHL